MGKRKIIFVVIYLFLSYILLPSVNAEANAYVSATALRVRENPTTESNVIVKIYNGEPVTVVDTNKVSGPGCDDGWYKIEYDGKTGYVCSTYIKMGTINSSYNSTNYEARVYANSVSVRSYASSSASKITSLLNGTNLRVTETLQAGNGCNDPWYKVNYHDNRIGYICSTYVIRKEDVTDTDAEYEATLTEAGFPSSYIPYLVYLHKKHPNWIFRPIITNLKWDNVISGESGKNYIQNPTEEVYRTSSVPAEGKTWFEATDGVNAFFIDPRNFLTEKFIFMFENLQFDEQTQTAEIVKSVFGSSYLSDDEYVNYFINAGRDFNVSPVHLAARVVQEGGANSNYVAITGTSTHTYRGHSLAGFYNYYNIGAYEDAYTNSAVTRGLAYAAGLVGGNGTSLGRPWTTREKAIRGGAEFISNGYIGSGQYTLYFEKFNTSPTSSYSPYTHQYMTNVQAPTSEGSNIQGSLATNNLLDNAYVFAIPIYQDMPEVVSLPSVGDRTNTLNSIKVNNINISEFDKDVLSYTFYVDKNTTQVIIEATTTSPNSTVEGLNTYELDSDEEVITIKVTSQTGEIKIYSITIKKVEDTKTIEEIFNSLEVNISNNYIKNITKGITSNDLITNIKRSSPSANVLITTSTGTALQSTDVLATGQQLNIRTAANEDKTYTLVVIGDTSGDGNVTILDLLQVQKHILNSKALTNAYFEAGDTSGDGKITILDLLQIQKHLVEGKKL